MKKNIRIEILGVFGSGKTTLANMISKNKDYHPKLEDHKLNPYWGANALLDSGGNLAYDLSFLIQHFHLVQSSISSAQSNIICDWSFETDDLWASLRLDPDQLDSYRTTSSLFLKSIPKAAGYIYLDINPDEIHKRMQKRGRGPEILIGKEKIVHAHKILKSRIEKLHPENVLIINENLDLVKINNFINRENFNE